jgi:hypothetical protein
MSEPSVNTSLPKAKKARKPFVWTPERKATFEKMRAKRQESLANKKKAKDEGKLELMEEKKSLERLARIKEEMKKLLGNLDKPKEEEKPKVKPTIPEPIVENIENELEEEEIIPVHMPEIPKPKKELYRYTTQNQHFSLPKAPQQKIQIKSTIPPAPAKPQFMYL